MIFISFINFRFRIRHQSPRFFVDDEGVLREVPAQPGHSRVQRRERLHRHPPSGIRLSQGINQ